MYDTPPRRSARLQALEVGCTSNALESRRESPIRPPATSATEPPELPRRPPPQVHRNFQETLRELRDHLQLPRTDEHITNQEQEFSDSDESQLPYARESSCADSAESSDDEEDGYKDAPEVELQDLLRPPPELRHNPRWLPRRRPRNRGTPTFNAHAEKKDAERKATARWEFENTATTWMTKVSQ
jgi:hypothetical protein